MRIPSTSKSSSSRAFANNEKSNRAGSVQPNLSSTTTNPKSENQDDENESCAYESIATAAANDEFERYIRLETTSAASTAPQVIATSNAAVAASDNTSNGSCYPKPCHLTPFIDTESGSSYRSVMSKPNNLYQLHSKATTTQTPVVVSTLMSDVDNLVSSKNQEALSAASFRSSTVGSGTGSGSGFMSSRDEDLYARVLEKLARSSLDSPAIVPLLCVRSFGPSDLQWNQLLTRYLLIFFELKTHILSLSLRLV